MVSYGISNELRGNQYWRDNIPSGNKLHSELGTTIKIDDIGVMSFQRKLVADFCHEKQINTQACENGDNKLRASKYG